MLQHHVIVLLSEFEGLPMAVVEGMACGLVPVCLYEPSGVPELIDNDINGIIVTDREASFLRAIDSLKDATVWSRLSVEARRTVEARYVHEVVFASWKKLIDDLSADAFPKVAKIPARVNLRNVHRPDLFVGYPRGRPSRGALLSHSIRSSWTQLRQAVRPRSRMREFAARLRAQ
jgi:hypothetical protein